MPSFKPDTQRRITQLKRIAKRTPIKVYFYILSGGDGFSQEVSWFTPSWQTSWVQGLYAPMGREAWFINSSTSGTRALRALHVLVFRDEMPDSFEPEADMQIEFIADGESMGLYQINAVIPRMSTSGQIYAWEIQAERQT